MSTKEIEFSKTPFVPVGLDSGHFNRCIQGERKLRELTITRSTPSRGYAGAATTHLEKAVRSYNNPQG